MRGYIAGTRGSALARRQTESVEKALAASRESRGLGRCKVHTRIVETAGDASLAERLVGTLDKGFFTAELELALRDRQIDWAVHSLKDLPTELPTDLALPAVLPRAAANDVLVVRREAFVDRGPGVLPLVEGARVGTSSLRRDALLRTFAPSVASLPLRGNVPTRFERLREGRYEAIVVAQAGVDRLALPLDEWVVVALDPRRWQPAPGQGAIAVQTRAEDEAIVALLAPLDHAPTRVATARERDFLRSAEGGCATPLGCHVAGEHAWIGREVAGAWRDLAVVLPAEPATLDAPFLQRTLADLVPAQENPHGLPLWHGR